MISNNVIRNKPNLNIRKIHLFIVFIDESQKTQINTIL